ncbi:MAG: hypothetical protein IT410_04230 [Candidatus Doudnabacteria bacterium]|nr:hypothetical protein [Candidatus Doudnabacteria bacterium]
MSESEKGHVPEQEKEKLVHLPIHEKWIIRNDPNEIEENIQRLDDLLNNIYDNWLGKNQIEEISKKFHTAMARLEKSKDLKSVEAKISANHSFFTVTIPLGEEVIIIPELNHYQKLQR